MQFGGVQSNSQTVLRALPRAAGGVVLTKPRRWGSGLELRGGVAQESGPVIGLLEEDPPVGGARSCVAEVTSALGPLPARGA